MSVRIALLLICSSVVPSFADDYPDRLLGFFKPGMHVAVLSADDGQQLTIFASEIQRKIASDVQSLGLDELREKYDAVERQVQGYLASLSEEGIDRPEDLQLMVLLTKQPRSFGKIVHVAENFLILEYESGRRRVMPEWQIADVQQDDGKLTIHGTRKDADGTLRIFHPTTKTEAELSHEREPE